MIMLLDAMISVIIPTYKSAKILDKALSSVYRNDFKDFETIVVDDASGDNTRDVVKNYPAQYISLDHNQGAAFARNKGAEVAKGDILLFVDADVEVQDNLLSQKRHRKYPSSLTGETSD